MDPLLRIPPGMEKCSFFSPILRVMVTCHGGAFSLLNSQEGKAIGSTARLKAEQFSYSQANSRNNLI